MIKLLSILMVLLLGILCGCQNNKNEFIEKETSTESTYEISTFMEKEIQEETPYMFMLEGRLYVDTGETESRITCGTMDRGFEKEIDRDEIPDEDGEVNFQCGFNGAQCWDTENRYVAWVDDAWHIFACNENNLDGVTMEVVEATNHNVKIKITNESDKNITFGDDFSVQKLDENVQEWRRVEEICEYAYHDIAYEVAPGKSVEKEIEFEWLYGILEPGTYRIVKTVMDFRGTGDYTNYWYLAEFTVKG